MDKNYEEEGMKESVFYRKTRAQQEAALKKFHNLPVKTVDIIPIDLENTNEADTMSPLSLPLEDFGIIRVPFSILARMYHRASLILARKEENIHPDPGRGDNLPRYVANEAIDAPSYAVCKKRTVRRGTYYVCSGTCIDFKAYDICAHTLAVAEMGRSLTEFVHCYKTTNQRPPNVDALIHMDLPPGRGSKKTKATQRRKGATNKKRKEVVESYTNTSPTDQSASNPASTLVRSSGNRGTEKEAEKTTTQKDTEEPQNNSPNTSTPAVQEGSFQLSLLKRCSPLVRCYGCKGVLKLRRGEDFFYSQPTRRPRHNIKHQTGLLAEWRAKDWTIRKRILSL